MLIGGIEAGGTKFNCAVADEQLNIIEKISIKTMSPEETLEQVIAFFDRFPVDSFGIGSFGPIGVCEEKTDYGHILATPKKGWSQFDFLGAIKKVYPVPIAWTTDVNAAAYGEVKLGAARGKKSCIYLTIGTGIGGGIISEGKIYEGINHPEMGHIVVKRAAEDYYEGTCQYHHDCLEGLAAGPSLEARTRIRGEDLPAEHEVWDLQAYYLAQALMNYTLILAPEIIVLGGGVMNQGHLLVKVREQFEKLLAGYVNVPPLEEYIVPWGLPNQSGLLGALLLAKEKINMNELVPTS